MDLLLEKNFKVQAHCYIELKNCEKPLQIFSSTSSVEESNIVKEMDVLKTNIEEELLHINKTLSDIKSVSIKLTFLQKK